MRRNRRFSLGDFRMVEGLLPHVWSPEQIAVKPDTGRSIP
ncbi:MAG: hypothetical protein OJF55_002320 [Rhodanobacteraceae bacterium]|nr:MAG: hypothetical protein OJF55_002320 [Rhodanobacteraceae bacterium]